MTRKAGPAALSAVLTWVTVALFFSVFIRPGLVDRGRGNLESSIDLEAYFLPRYALGSDLLLRGHLPVWNQFEYGGIPLLAMGQPAALYPPKILLFGLLSPVTAHWVFLIVHFFLFASGMLLFLRDRKITGVPAFVGAALAVFTIPLLDSNYHPNRIATLAWIPILYVLSERVVRGSVVAFALLACTVAVQLTAGYPEVTIDIGLLLAAHATAAFVRHEWSRPPWKILPVLGGAFVLGAIAAALQLLPLAEVGRVAARDIMAEHGRAAVLGGPRTPILLVPGFIAFALIGLVVPKGRPGTLGFLICGFVAREGWRFLRFIPGFGMVRFGFTWMFISVFFLGWIGAAGCDAVMTPGVLGDRARRGARGLVAALGLVMSACWAFEWRRLATGAASPVTPWSLNVGAPAAALLGIAAGIAIAVTALLFVTSTRAWAAAALLATIAHLRAYPFGAPPAPFGPPAETGIVARLHGDPSSIRSRVLAPDDVLFGYEITDRLPSPLGAEISFMPWRFRQIGHELGYITMFALIDWPRVVRARGFLDAMDVGYVAGPKSLAGLFTGAGFSALRSSDEVALFENGGHLGHAWVNYAARVIPSQSEALHYVLGPEFDPHREVVLEAPTRGGYAARSELAAAPPLTEEHPAGTTEFEVTLPEPGILVFSESFYPGRTATVDGHEAELLRANYVLCAVELAAGSHRVRFGYDPPSVRWGLALSLAGTAIVVLLLIYGVFGRRRIRGSLPA